MDILLNSVEMDRGAKWEQVGDNKLNRQSALRRLPV
jgi:hypothetical protein